MKIETLNEVLSGLNIRAMCVAANFNQHFASFDLKLLSGGKVNHLVAMSKEIALHLQSSSIPIFRVVSKSGVIRMQIITHAANHVSLQQLWNEYKAPKEMFLPCLLGKTDESEPLWMDINQNPHLLIAGSTGSGKSVLLHNIIANVADKSQLFLSDCKKVEFIRYSENKSVKKLVASYEATYQMLEELAEEMELRYELLAAMRCRDITQVPHLLEKYVVIIDEVADLMTQDTSGKLEAIVIKLAAKARAAGIYLFLATQHPSVKILTGLIKANFPARLACKVSSNVDSRVILDTVGAEHLVGRGDALFRSPTQDLIRFQIAMPYSE